MYPFFCAGVALSPSLCEANLLLSWTHLKLHSFPSALQHAHTGTVPLSLVLPLCLSLLGLSSLNAYPAVLAGCVGWKLQ